VAQFAWRGEKLFTKGFLIWNSPPGGGGEKGLQSFRRIAKIFGQNVSQGEMSGLSFAVLGTQLPKVSGGIIDFYVRYDDNSDGAYLRVTISRDSLMIETDWAGSIRAFYGATNNGFVVSTFDACLGAQEPRGIEDIDTVGMFGFLRYSHLLWDETAWLKTKSVPPDSKLTFSTAGVLVDSHAKASIRSTEERHNKPISSLISELDDLNQVLVQQALSGSDQVVLPLSSGYDSRLVLSAMSRDSTLKRQARLFTYGPEGSIEVEAARRLAEISQMRWERVQLECNFLRPDDLVKAHSVFGSSLPMHSMYQSEFIEILWRKGLIEPGSRFVSGFMTGVPAGQHTGLSLDDFSQSHVWTDAELELLPAFCGSEERRNLQEKVEFVRGQFEGEPFQKDIMVDIWTRQRNFISYYPRIFSMYGGIVSPHMHPDYVNFFMSLPFELVHRRGLVEKMLLQKFPTIAAVPSNSHPRNSLLKRHQVGFGVSRLLNLARLQFIVPSLYKNKALDFDIPSLRRAGIKGFYPLFEQSPKLEQLRDLLGGTVSLEKTATSALLGDVREYEKLLVPQSLAFELNRPGV